MIEAGMVEIDVKHTGIVETKARREAYRNWLVQLLFNPVLDTKAPTRPNYSLSLRK